MLVCISLTYLAKANAVAAFANSLGCKLKFPNPYQEVAPLIFFPKTKRPSNEIREII